MAEKLVAGWSAFEYREKFDDEIAKALGKHDGRFDVNAEKYTRRIEVQPPSFGADANAATVATAQRTKQRLHNFHSFKWNGEYALRIERVVNAPSQLLELLKPDAQSRS